MGRVLLVDDDRGVLTTLCEVMIDRGHEVVLASSGEEALARCEGVETAIVDLAMPGMDGLQLLKLLRSRDEALPILMLTAHGSERVAVEATRAGAWDYLKKPFDIDEIAVAVDRALETYALRTANRRLVAERAVGTRVIGESPAMRRLFDAITRVSRRDVTVLVRGETGTGKELVATLLHAQSGRAKGPLVRFNCAAIPAELAEAELFGHAKGAFTGAVQARRGFFAQAHGGTLVLDEVGELPLPIQAKILRAIQEGEIQPVGSGRVERVDVRIVASTHRDLLAEATAGRFREDLYYRLAVVELVVPSLRERRSDIPLLAEELCRRYALKFGVEDARLSAALVAELEAMPWPGNVRQLENRIARMVVMSAGGEIDVEALEGADATNATPSGGASFAASSVSSVAPTSEPLATAEHDGAKDDAAKDDAAKGGGAPREGTTEGLTLKEQVDAFERGLILRAYLAAGKNQSETARRLGVSRATLLDKMKRYGIGASS